MEEEKKTESIDKAGIVKLKIRAIFGINGKVDFGLHLHPNGRHLIFPLGTKIGIDDLKTNTQQFIAGHTNNISCLDLSRRYFFSLFLLLSNISILW